MQDARRRYLRLVAGLVAGAGLAGCAAVAPGDETAPAPRPPPGNPDWLVEYGTPATLCGRGAVPDVGIPAIVDPAFARDWSAHEIPFRYWFERALDDPLPDATVVAGVAAAGRARAYPIMVLWFHEVVNDVFLTPDGAAVPFLVTYCPITASVMAAVRRVDGEAATFTVSGHLWQPPAEHTVGSVANGWVTGATTGDPDEPVRNGGNLVVVDDVTGSYWTQLLAKGVCGLRRSVPMETVPVTTATWGDWRRAHPETDVLLPPPHSVTV